MVVITVIGVWPSLSRAAKGLTGAGATQHTPIAGITQALPFVGRAGRPNRNNLLHEVNESNHGKNLLLGNNVVM
jgi:hypothetical protein